MDTFFASPEAQICRQLSEASRGSGPRIVRPPAAADPVQEFARSSAAGLASPPRRLESRFLYDAQGSILFDQITTQPEYYLTRTEASILAANAARIRTLTGPVNIVELGAGSAAKTDHLLRAWLERSKTACYFPVDVSLTALLGASKNISARFRAARVIAVNCEYGEAFPLLLQLSPVLVTFLGSSIGNFSRSEMTSFCLALAASMRPGDFFLLGLDLVKRSSVLEAAYNDRAGVTGRFTRNIFARMNRELGCAIDLESIEHSARYRAELEQIEIDACFTKQQTFLLHPPGRAITIAEGESVRTEISRKFRLEQVIPELNRCGFGTEQVFSDERRWFALLLLRRLPRYCGQSGRS